MDAVKINKNILYLTLFITAWAISNFSILSDMVRVWDASNTFTHCFFILPISLYLIWEKRQDLNYGLISNQWFWLVALGLSQAGVLFGHLLGVNFVSQVFTYSSLIFLLLTLLGWRFCWQISFPLFFLVFCIPFGEEFIPQLQEITASFAIFWLNLTDVPVYREGLYLYLPNGTFLVAEACAGIRFLIASIALGTLYAYLIYTKVWKRVTFVVVSFIVPIVANGIRAFGIVYIGYSTNMEHATGVDHLVYGWLFFSLVLFILFWLGHLGRDPIPPKNEKIKQHLANNKNQTVIIVLSILLLIAPDIYQRLVVESSQNALSAPSLTEKLSTQFSNIRPAKFNWLPQFNDSTEQWSGLINTEQVFVANYSKDNNEHELVSGLHRSFNDEHWSRISENRIQVGQQQINELELVNQTGQRITLYHWYVVNGVISSSRIETKLNQLQSKLTGNGGAGLFISVATSRGELPNWFKLSQQLNKQN